MILPSKHMAEDRALLTVGATILRYVSRATTVSALWEKMSPSTAAQHSAPVLSYDEFVLALDMLFLLGAIELNDGLLHRRIA